MHGVLNENLFLVKKQVGFYRLANYDIYDPETGHITMECREKRLGIVTKIFRCIDCYRMTPFDIQVRIPHRHQIVRVTRGISVFLSGTEINVLDEKDRRIGGIKHRHSDQTLSVFDTSGRPVCRLVVEENPIIYNRLRGSRSWLDRFVSGVCLDLDPESEARGSWVGCNFKFMADETELAHVTKNSEAIGKGGLDNYVLEIADSVTRDNVVRQLILAAVMCIDMVRPAFYLGF